MHSKRGRPDLIMPHIPLLLAVKGVDQVIPAAAAVLATVGVALAQVRDGADAPEFLGVRAEEDQVLDLHDGVHDRFEGW